MDKVLLESELTKIKDIELSYKKGNKLSYEKLSYIDDTNIGKIYLLHYGVETDFFINRMERYTPIPTHMHNFIEINYVYSGEYTLYINSSKYTLHKGQIVLIDTKTPHYICPLSENDIVVEFLLSKDYFNHCLSDYQNSNNPLTIFFIRSFNDDNSNLNHIIFDSVIDTRLQFFIISLLWEHFHPSLNTKGIHDSLFSLIILDMLNMLENCETYVDNRTNSYIFSALQYMDQNFLTCSLKDTAAHVGLNPTYLTEKLKEHTIKSYKELIIQLKMEYAGKLLISTDMPIDDIGRKCGYQNLSFFYKKFKSHYHCLPLEYKKKNKK